MKPSEFYEKYWKINGESPPPLTENQKKWLDEVCSSPVNVFKMQFKRKPSGQTIDIDIEKMDEAYKKLPQFLKP